jgi:hypothetical protein
METHIIIWIYYYFAPLAHARQLWIHWQTTEDVRQQGHCLAQLHLEYFLKMLC